jgi:hypothetical protein
MSPDDNLRSDRRAELRGLLTPHGQEALAAAEAFQPDEGDYLQFFQKLSRTYPPNLARPALTQAILRRKAVGKFSRSEEMYFDREALEQSTGELIASYRARKFQDFSTIFDFGSGFGGDSLALAAWAPVVAVDQDAYRLSLLQANAAALHPKHSIRPIIADLKRLPLHIPTACAVFFDPARRLNGRRVKAVEAYRPPLSIIRDWLPFVSGLGVKCSPAVRIDEIEQYPAGQEFISVEGELKEAVLWFGDLNSTERQATLLPGPHVLQGIEPDHFRISQPLGYIYEPDPAVMRARLVRVLGDRLDAAQLDPSIALLTSDQKQETFFARRYRLKECIPFGLKRLRKFLRQRSVGRVVLKKRGSAVEVESFTRQLNLKGENEATLILTVVESKKSVLWVEPD